MKRGSQATRLYYIRFSHGSKTLPRVSVAKELRCCCEDGIGQHRIITGVTSEDSGAITIEMLLENGDFPFVDQFLQSIETYKERME